MANGFKQFIKDNHGGVGGAAFAGLTAISNLSGTDSKLKGLLKTLRDLALIKFTWTTALASSFGGLTKAVRGLVKDTGSLQAALDRLSSVQKLTRTFNGLTGSMEQAKQKVASLMKLSGGQGKVFSFEQWGRAAQGLQVFTRGAYAGTEALKTIGDAAAATGNSLEDTGDAVGSLYDALRNGQPIEGAVEKMRQMGLISSENADSLDLMAQSGASVDQVFSQVTATLAKHNDGMKDLSATVEGVTARFAKAKQTLAEGVGEAWTDEEVENTQNAAEALENITPSLVRVSSFYAKLSGGISTVQSWLIKQATAIPGVGKAFETLANGIGIVTAALTALAVVGLPAAIKGLNLLINEGGTQLTAKLLQMGVGFTAASRGVGIFTTALRAMTIAGGVLVAITAITALVGAVINFAKEGDKAAKDAEDFATGLQKGTNALKARIDAVHTLTEKNEALAASIERLKELDEADKSTSEEELGPIDSFIDSVTGGKKQKAIQSKMEAVALAKVQAKKEMARTQGIDNAGLQAGERGMAVMHMGASIQRRIEDLTYQQSMATGSNLGKRSDIQDRIAILQGRAGQAQIGLQAAANKELGIGGAAPGTSTHALEMMGKTSGQDRANWEYYAKEQADLENSLPDLLSEIKSLTLELTQTNKANNAADLDISSKRSMQEALLSGDSNKVQRLGNMDAFKQRYDELIAQGVPQGRARGEAGRYASNAIALNANEHMLDYAQSAKISSLRSIGGGGNVGPGAGDPLLDVNKQQKDLLEDIDKHIEKLLEQPSGGFKIK
jgi:hypothetical protein